MIPEAELYTSSKVFCWMDKWHGMTMADIRALEEETKAKLDEERNKVGNLDFLARFLTIDHFRVKSRAQQLWKSKGGPLNQEQFPP